MSDVILTTIFCSDRPLGLEAIHVCNHQSTTNDEVPVQRRVHAFIGSVFLSFHKGCLSVVSPLWSGQGYMTR